jgi:hypothetical protein
MALHLVETCRLNQTPADPLHVCGAEAGGAKLHGIDAGYALRLDDGRRQEKKERSGEKNSGKQLGRAAEQKSHKSLTRDSPVRGLQHANLDWAV